jgi:hypothetical protein
MGVTERLLVEVDAKTGGAVSEFKKLGDSAEAAAKKTTKAGQDTAKTSSATAAALRTGVATGAALASVALVKFGYDSVTAASDLSESMSKARQVFGSSADAVLKFGDTSATALGQSKQQAIEAAATFGNLFVALKLGQKPAADMSTRMVTLAGDLASFNNVDPAKVLEDLRSGLLGESEPLRKYGVALNEATVQQRAMAETGKTNAKQLTEGEKIVARYHLILANTTTAQGDFARTSTGLANQQRILKASFSDFSAQVGAEFMPLMQQAVSSATNLLHAFSAIPAPVKSAAFTISEFALAGALAGKAIDGTVGRLSGLDGKIGAVGVAFRGLGRSLPYIGAVAASMYELNKAVNSIDLSGMSGLPDKLIQVAAGKEPIKALEGEIGSFNATLNNTGKVAELAGAVLARFDEDLGNLARGNPDAAKKVFGEVTATLQEQGYTAQQVADKFPAYANAIKTASASAVLGEQQQAKMTSELEKQKTAAQQLTEALATLAGKHLSAVESGIRFKDILAKTGEELAGVEAKYRSSARALDENTQAGRDMKSAVIDAAKAAIDHGQAVADETKSIQRGEDATRKDIGALRTWALQHGLNKQQVDLLIGSMVDLGKQRPKPTVSVNDAAAKRSIASMAGMLSSLDGKVVHTTVSVTTNTHGVPLSTLTGAHAAGGMASGLSLVGERGPEIVDFQRPAQVYPFDVSRRLVAAASGGGNGGGNTYNISVNVPPTANPAEAGLVLVDAIREYERRSGKSWRAS